MAKVKLTVKQRKAIESLPEWSPGAKYAGTPFFRHRILAFEDAYSPAADRLRFQAVYNGTSEDDFPLRHFRHWTRKYVSMILVPPDTMGTALSDLMDVLEMLDEEDMIDQKDRDRALQADADDAWKGLSIDGRRSMLTDLKMSLAQLNATLPPTSNPLLTLRLAQAYAERYRQKFGPPTS